MKTERGMECWASTVTMTFGTIRTAKLSALSSSRTSPPRKFLDNHNILITNKTHANVDDLFYSLNSHQHVSAGIAAIFTVILLQEYKSTNVVSCLNKGWPTRWHLLYYILLNMFQTLMRPSSGASEYLLCCVGWLEACWCYVAGLSVGDVVSECRLSNI